MKIFLIARLIFQCIVKNGQSALFHLSDSDLSISYLLCIWGQIHIIRLASALQEFHVCQLLSLILTFRVIALLLSDLCSLVQIFDKSLNL